MAEGQSLAPHRFEWVTNEERSSAKAFANVQNCFTTKDSKSTKGSEDKCNVGDKLPTLPKSLFFCSVSSLSATLSFGLWTSFILTTIFFCSCTRPIADVRLNQLPFFVPFVVNLASVPCELKG